MKNINAGIPLDANMAGSGPVSPAAAAAATTTTRRKRATPAAKVKDGRVSRKETELRDARALKKLRSAIEKLSPWGRGELLEDIKKLGAPPPTPPGAPLYNGPCTVA